MLSFVELTIRESKPCFRCERSITKYVEFYVTTRDRRHNEMDEERRCYVIRFLYVFSNTLFVRIHSSRSSIVKWDASLSVCLYFVDVFVYGPVVYGANDY